MLPYNDPSSPWWCHHPWSLPHHQQWTAPPAWSNGWSPSCPDSTSDISQELRPNYPSLWATHVPALPSVRSVHPTRFWVYRHKLVKLCLSCMSQFHSKSPTCAEAWLHRLARPEKRHWRNRKIEPTEHCYPKKKLPVTHIINIFQIFFHFAAYHLWKRNASVSKAYLDYTYFNLSQLQYMSEMDVLSMRY